MLEPDFFRDHRERSVTVNGGDVSIEAKVVEVKEMDRFEGQERPRFSVVLQGPLEPVLEQRIYEFKFPDGQRHSMFMVPIGPQGDAMRYELVFT